MTNPYVYLIGWKKLDVWYAGVRYKRNCHPDDLWKTYFTSSKYVKEFVKNNGNPDVLKILKVFETEDQARNYEQDYLNEQDVLNKSNWLNRAIGGHNAGTKGLIMTEETKRKISLSKLGKTGKTPTKEHVKKQKDTYKKNYYSNYEENFKKKSLQLSGIKRSEKQKLKLSELNTGKKLKDETKEKIGKASKGKKWFTDGKVSKFCYDCPEGFYQGRVINKSS